MLAAYIGLLKYSARYPELEMDDPNNPVLELPEVGPTVKVGLYFLLPLALLTFALMKFLSDDILGLHNILYQVLFSRIQK